MALPPPDYRPVNCAIGNGLRVMREERGYDLPTMANLLHITPQTLQAYELGTNPIPATTLHHADLILKAGFRFYVHPFSTLNDLYRFGDNVIPFTK